MMVRCGWAREDRMVVFYDVRASVNSVGVNGARALASALEMNNTLQHLDVGRELFRRVFCLIIAMLSDERL